MGLSCGMLYSAALMMETVSSSETWSVSTRLDGVTSQKTAIFVVTFQVLTAASMKMDETSANSTRLRGAVTQKTAIFLLAAVRTSELTCIVWRHHKHRRICDELSFMNKANKLGSKLRINCVKLYEEQLKLSVAERLLPSCSTSSLLEVGIWGMCVEVAWLVRESGTYFREQRVVTSHFIRWMVWMPPAICTTVLLHLIRNGV
jgi:hypothetical protein